MNCRSPLHVATADIISKAREQLYYFRVVESHGQFNLPSGPSQRRVIKTSLLLHSRRGCRRVVVSNKFSRGVFVGRLRKETTKSDRALYGAEKFVDMIIRGLFLTKADRSQDIILY